VKVDANEVISLLDESSPSPIRVGDAEVDAIVRELRSIDTSLMIVWMGLMYVGIAIQFKH